MSEKVIVKIKLKNAKDGIKIIRDKYGLWLSTTRNGWHWSSIPVNDSVLRMIKKAIDVYFKKKEKKDVP